MITCSGDLTTIFVDLPSFEIGDHGLRLSVFVILIAGALVVSFVTGSAAGCVLAGLRGKSTVMTGDYIAINITIVVVVIIITRNVYRTTITEMLTVFSIIFIVGMLYCSEYCVVGSIYGCGRNLVKSGSALGGSPA